MPNLFHRIGACAGDIARHVELFWAEFLGDDLRALKIMKEITVADLSKLTAAVDRVIAKSAADAAALQTALDANANLQPDIDALTAKLDTIAQEVPAPALDMPAAPDAGPVIDPPVLDLNPNRQPE